jgi:hypothetical protein
LNTTADPTAGLANSGAFAVARSDNNAQDFPNPLNNVRYAGWWRSLRELYDRVEKLIMYNGEVFDRLVVTGGLDMSISAGQATLSGANLVRIATVGDYFPTWHTVLELDFSGMADMPMLTDGNYNLTSATAIKKGSSKQYTAVTSGGIINGSGLALPPNGGSQPDDSWQRPSLLFNLQALYAGFNLFTPVRASMISLNNGNAANDVSHWVSIGVTGATAESTTPSYTMTALGVGKRMSNNAPATTSGITPFARAGGAAGSYVEITSAEVKAFNQFRVTAKDGIGFGGALIEGSASTSAWDVSPATLRALAGFQGYGLANNSWRADTNILLSQFDPANAFVALMFGNNGAAVVPPAIKALKIELFY